jgi:hypothetical protein
MLLWGETAQGHIRARPSPAHSLKTCQLHQALNAFVVDAQSHVAQLGLYTGAPVGAIAHGVYLANALSRHAIVDATPAGGA